MVPRLRLGVVGACVATAFAALLGSTAAAQGGPEAFVEQIGTYDYLISPDYDGLAPLSFVLTGQTLGLGTFDRLDGELVIVGGQAYRVGVDGTPQLVSAERGTPFAETIPFTPERSGPVAPGTPCSALPAAVNALAGTDAGIIAVRVRGTFTNLVTRSVSAQSSPYVPRATAIAGQTVFPLGQRVAVLVGFRTGADLAGTGAPGLHLHGLTTDRSAGGHVLSCVAGSDVQLSVQRAAGVRVVGASADAGE
jgi:acetolactate decarboxylase